MRIFSLITGFILTILASHPVYAQASTEAVDEPNSESPNTNKKTTAAEAAQRAVINRGDAVARWLDAFFDEPNSTAEQASSRIELRQSVTFSEREDTDYPTRVSAKLNLPNLSRKLSLTFQGNADEGELEDGAAQEFDDGEEDALDNPALGLQYIFREHNGYHGSFSIGTRLDNPSINLGPRFRYQHHLSTNWRARYTQRLLWDTDDGWESRSKAEFDRTVGDGHLWRQSLRADWLESKKDSRGMRYTFKHAFVQRLQDNAAISYEVSSRYTTKPRMSWTQHVVRTRYRRTLGRDWIFLEVGPFVSFSKEHDWHPNPGIRISLDFVFAEDTPLDMQSQHDDTDISNQVSP